MADIRDENDQAILLYRVEDSVISQADPVQIRCASELLRAGGMRVSG